MSTEQDQILRILGEATEPLFASEVTERLNAELAAGSAFETAEVMKHLQSLYHHVTQLTDGRWTLKRLMR